MAVRVAAIIMDHTTNTSIVTLNVLYAGNTRNCMTAMYFKDLSRDPEDAGHRQNKI